MICAEIQKSWWNSIKACVITFAIDIWFKFIVTMPFFMIILFLKSCCWKFQITIRKTPVPGTLFESTHPTFQRRIIVVSTLWINVEITLIRHWKWNKIRCRIFNVAKRWYNISARRWNNVETTLHNVKTILVQPWYNFVST